MQTAEDNLGLSIRDIEPLDSNESNSNNNYSEYQPLMNDSPSSKAVTNANTNTPSNSS